MTGDAPTPPHPRFDGCAVLITGASRGIGEAAARRFAAAGARVLLAARTVGAVERIAGEIRDAGGEALATGCDVARWDDVAAAVDFAVARFDRLDILVNNAGVIEPIARLADSDPEAWAQAFAINALGVYHGLRAAAPPMRAQAALGQGRLSDAAGRALGGVVVNISSGAATGALEGWSHYCASKAAALSLTRCADGELGPEGVRVIGLSPGTVATEMQVAIKASGVNPVSRLDPSAHIPADWPARAILWLCTPEGLAHAGSDVSLRAPEIRAAVGLT